MVNHYTAVESIHARIVFFFFQAEDGIRDLTVTGVQTCALPICVVDCFVQRTVRSTKQSTTPLQAVPGLGTKLESQSKRSAPSGRTLPPRLMRDRKSVV